jgi:hypothetical protein
VPGLFSSLWCSNNLYFAGYAVVVSNTAIDPDTDVKKDAEFQELQISDYCHTSEDWVHLMASLKWSKDDMDKFIKVCLSLSYAYIPPFFPLKICEPSCRFLLRITAWRCTRRSMTAKFL